MNQATDMLPESSHEARRTGRRKLLPLVAAAVFIGLCVSQASLSLPAPRPEFEAQPARAVQEDDARSQSQRAVAAAEKFLKVLDADQRARALLTFDSAKRPGWSNLPVTMVPRNGVELTDLTKDQRAAALAVVAAVLSKEGYQKVIGIMDGDEVLASGKGGKAKGGKGKGGKAPRGMFGNQKYYLALFGKPSLTQPWLVQFGGHHLGLNVTVVGDKFVLTPTHTGTQPASFTWKGKTVRPLGPENDLAFKLINALDEKQQAQAILGQNPRNLILGPGQDGRKIEPRGIKASALTGPQQAILLELIGAWVNMLREPAASSRNAEIKAGIADTYFAWSGSTTNGQQAYYRIQGPTLVIEYAPQGTTDHIHTIIRNPENDYGVKFTSRP